VLLDLLFVIYVFWLKWLGLQVGTWGGLWVGVSMLILQMGKVFQDSLSSACICNVFVAKCFLPVINLDSQIMLCTFCLVAKLSLLI
jgi:hypothetical protein